ncbi:hypothetical protein LDO32_03460 [Luteimonas sp. Y-2-2-4F]|nr:hypothetical protein [Luteimonas sp. Y-2-2-4F]MCD9030792.1 hypothetical protein [Luteimonas sp. Y-2-2-4F]
MSKTQAGAIARAIMESDLQAQGEIRATRAVEVARLKRQRKIAVCTLVDSACGAVAAYLLTVRFTTGIIWAGLAAALCWAIARSDAA